MLKRCLLLLLLLMMLSSAAVADEAQDITANCCITATGSKVDTTPLLDRKYKTAYTLRKGGTLDICAQEPLSGLFIQFHDQAAVCDILVERNGEWQPLIQTSGEYLTGWLPLPEDTARFRLHNSSGGKATIAELTVYSAGERPARAAEWRMLDKCELMLLVAHPDDEVLWFGGLLPTYAGERQLPVQPVFLTPTTPQRRLELLDALWHCGVTAYPTFANMCDLCGGSTLSAQYTVWNPKTLYARVERIIRQYRPEVLVTHDFQGEYRHGAHIACADAAVHAVQSAAEAADGWQVKKLYVHLFQENPVAMNWHVPLERFGGKTALTIADEALAYHASQTYKGWTMEKASIYDNSLYGLYFSTVGSDIIGGDFMENIE